MRRTAILLTSILALSGLAAPALAQTPPAGSEAAQCPYVKPLDAAVQAKILDLLVVPGNKLDMATLAKDPSLLQALQQVNAQQAASKPLDWAALCRYKAANDAQRMKAAPRVVFLGDSITEFWGHADPALFSDAVVDRGISGQTTSQILLRFYSDVVTLHPAVVHLIAGTNDVAQNEGPISDADILNNIRAMIVLAKANHIKVVLGSIPPMVKVAMRPNLQPAPRIVALNDSLKRMAAEQHIVFVNYYDVLTNSAGGMRAELSNDGVHPNRDGYAAMRPLVERAIAARK